MKRWKDSATPPVGLARKVSILNVSKCGLSISKTLTPQLHVLCADLLSTTPWLSFTKIYKNGKLSILLTRELFAEVAGLKT